MNQNNAILSSTNSTIAAIASGIVSSGIGVIRVSGPDSISIVNRIFVSPGKSSLLEAPGYSAHYGHIFFDGAVLDEVVVIVFKNPHSFTGEDVVEIDCHGGIFVMQKILSVILSLGAVTADPGEFTKRAFINGRIDLTQAESVMDIISSKNEKALSASMGQLSGRLSEKIRAMRETLLHEIAFMEAALDDPEHYSLDGYYEKLTDIISDLRTKISVLIDSYNFGKTINDGIKTVIIGSPNAGKSSLLNALSGDDRAIVTDIPGTTRDILYENINIKGIPLKLIDTAGIRKSDNEIEKIGIAKAKEAAGSADLILFVIDSSREKTSDESDIISYLSELPNSSHVILIMNKCDLECKYDISGLEAVFGENIANVSAKYDIGIDSLCDMIHDRFYTGDFNYNEEIVITAFRHYELLRAAAAKLDDISVSLENNIPEDFISSDMVLVYGDLGSVIGEAVEDDIVDRIFSEFCMGK